MIALFTDYGRDGPYVGQLHAVLASLGPGVPIVDLMHDVPPFNVRSGAHLLAACAPFVPKDAIFLAVVDPGVGGSRGGIIVTVASQRFVGPDNGLLAVVARRAGSATCQSIGWIPPDLPASFHGRDWFAPVAARLARGEAIEGLVTTPTIPEDDGWTEDLEEIIYVDRFGNAMTGRRSKTLPDTTVLRVHGRVIPRARVFSEVPTGEVFWYSNSNGLVEIAANRASAAERLGLRVGDGVQFGATSAHHG